MEGTTLMILGTRPRLAILADALYQRSGPNYSLHPFPKSLPGRNLPYAIYRPVKFPLCPSYTDHLQFPPDDIKWVREE